MGGGKGGSPTGYTTTTQTQNIAPWQTQQPYLQDVFGAAQHLYQNWVPQYYPTSTVSPITAAESGGLQNLINTASQWSGAPTTAAENALLGSLSGQSAFAANPAVDPLTQLSGGNLGLNNPGTNALSNLANYGVSGLSGIGNLAGSSIAPSQGVLASGLAPAENTLGYFASGAATDPFLSNVAQSTLANVVPSIESQFIQGGGLSNPQAAYATSQGASAALAPVISSALLQEQQNQLGAGQALGNLGISGAGALQNLSLNPASLLGNLALGGAGLQSGAASSLGNLALGGGGLQTQQLGDVSQAYQNALEQQLQGETIFPSVMQGAFAPAQMQYQAGAQQQQLNQQQLNDAINRWNYSWQLPYNMLNTYLSQVGGNYGSAGTGTTSQPYYINQGANILGGGLGALTGANMLFGQSGLFPGALAGLAGIFSDRRLKTNIKRIGTAANGLPLYLFRFYGKPLWQVGVMADEVEKVHPDAVYDGPFGFKVVDYEKAL